jgi:hypothetical protein
MSLSKPLVHTAAIMPARLTWLPLLLLLALAGASQAAEETSAVAEAGEDDAKQEKTVCELIDEAAAAHALPVIFFTRLIWKESRFRAGAVSPKGAEGIAQFMPATAARRRLADPFDPAEAIPASARYLKDLVRQFGNLGLAAAAYNAGEARVGGWIAGSRRLPAETRDYVLFITGRPAADWKPSEAVATENDGAAEATDTADCAEIAALLSKPGAGSVRVAVRLGGTADWAPWGVQVAGNFSASRALASYDALRSRHATLLDDHEPLVLSAVVRSRGTAPFHQVRLPFESRDDADRLCRALRKAGGACMVLKNAR